mmetsp:Transcript_1980/g.7152  ORF Transcript_1980/g.7152 Transcript_1980/m.7152 type:complete len:232 (-) Transcript_1980:387-1082(-)
MPVSSTIQEPHTSLPSSWMVGRLGAARLLLPKDFLREVRRPVRRDFFTSSRERLGVLSDMDTAGCWWTIVDTFRSWRSVSTAWTKVPSSCPKVSRLRLTWLSSCSVLRISSIAALEAGERSDLCLATRASLSPPPSFVANCSWRSCEMGTASEEAETILLALRRLTCRLGGRLGSVCSSWTTSSSSALLPLLSVNGLPLVIGSSSASPAAFSAATSKPRSRRLSDLGMEEM